MTSGLRRIKPPNHPKKKEIPPKVKTRAVKRPKMVWIIAKPNSLPQTRTRDPLTSTDLRSEGNRIPTTHNHQQRTQSRTIQKTTNLKLSNGSSQITNARRMCWQMLGHAPANNNGETLCQRMAMKSLMALRRDCRQIERDSRMNGQPNNNITTHTKWTTSQPILPQIEIRRQRWAKVSNMRVILPANATHVTRVHPPSAKARTLETSMCPCQLTSQMQTIEVNFQVEQMIQSMWLKCVLWATKRTRAKKIGVHVTIQISGDLSKDPADLKKDPRGCQPVVQPLKVPNQFTTK